MVIAVIGAGSIGRRHVANLQALGAEVEGIAWRDFDRAVFEKRRDISGLVVATATDVRLDLVQMAAGMSVPVYIEKPLHWTREGVAEIYETLGDLVQRSMLGFMARYSGVSVPPYLPPTSFRSTGRPTSAAAHITICTLLDVERPNTMAIVISLL